MTDKEAGYADICRQLIVMALGLASRFLYDYVLTRRKKKEPTSETE